MAVVKFRFVLRVHEAWVKFSARSSAILTEGFGYFPQSYNVNTGKVH